MEKYALLDTDFISKACSVTDDCNHKLIDVVLSMPSYTFFVHKKIEKELSCYDEHISEWMQEMQDKGKITVLSDRDIIDGLSSVLAGLSCAAYTMFLKNACDSFSGSCFARLYSELDSVDCYDISADEYLNILHRLDCEAGNKNSLGEIRTFVLLQYMKMMYEKKVYVFCSDDRDARNSSASFEDIRCISLVSLFARLKKETGWTLSEAKPFIESYVSFCRDHHQLTFRVIESSETGRFVRVPCEQVLTEIFEDKFVELKNGMLRYRS